MPRFESSTPSLIIYNTRTCVGYNEPVAPGHKNQKARPRDGCEAFCVVRQVWPMARWFRVQTDSNITKRMDKVELSLHHRLSIFEAGPRRLESSAWRAA
jgi:hypothetical protein